MSEAKSGARFADRRRIAAALASAVVVLGPCFDTFGHFRCPAIGKALAALEP